MLIDLPVIKTTSGWLFAMAIPYLTSLAVLGERNEPIRRWGLLKAIQESLLSVYLSVLTAFSFLRASFQNPRLFFVCSFSRCAEPDGNRFALVKSIAVYGLFILNAAALLGFVSDVLSAGPVLSQISFVSKGFFAMLAVANLIMLLANQAISHEARHIQAFLVQQKRLKATLVLDSGRTIACVTRNFPRLDLEIGVEAQGALTAAVFNQERCLLQLHHHNLPFNLLVKLEKVDGPLVSLQLLEASQSDFAALKDAVLSRGTDWPAWLPKKAADRVLPVWLADWFANVPSLLIDYSIKLTGMLRISHLLELIRR